MVDAGLPEVVAAIDPGLSHSGVACITWDRVSKPRVILAQVVAATSSERWTRLREMVNGTVNAIRAVAPRLTLVAIENYVAFAARSWSAHDTLLMVGALVQPEKWAGTGAEILTTATAQVVRRWLARRASIQGRTVDVAKNDKAIASEVLDMVAWDCPCPPANTRNHSIDAVALALYSLTCRKQTP